MWKFFSHLLFVLYLAYILYIFFIHIFYKQACFNSPGGFGSPHQAISISF